MSILSTAAAAVAQTEAAVVFAHRGWHQYWISCLFEKWPVPWLARFSLIQHEKEGEKQRCKLYAWVTYTIGERKKKSINNRSSLSCRCRPSVYYRNRKWNDTKSADWIWHRRNRIKKTMNIMRRNIWIYIYIYNKIMCSFTFLTNVLLMANNRSSYWYVE